MAQKINTHRRLTEILKSIHEEVSLVFRETLNDFDDNKLQIILVSYRKTSDSIIFWDLYEYSENKVKVLSNINIRNGEGTVGFIVKSGKPEMIGNTFEDPRGSVALEDFIIGNKSFFGIPEENNNELKYIISFSYDEYDIWEKKKEGAQKDKLIEDIKGKLKSYKNELLLLNDIQIRDKIHNAFVDESSDKLSALDRMMKIINETVDYSFLVYSQNNKIKQIKINDSLIENRIFTFLNWCSLFENKCSECPIDNPTCENPNCKYLTDFLRYLSPFDVIELPLDDNRNFVLKLYCNKKENSEKFNFTNDIKNVFSALINLFHEIDKIEDYKKNVKRKILSEIIHQIISHYTSYLINNDETVINNIPFDNFNTIISHYFNPPIILKKEQFTEVFEEIKIEIKDRLLLCELWQNNIEGIKISEIILIKDNRKYSLNGPLKLDASFYETATVKVLIDYNNIPSDKEDDIAYRPLIVSNDGDFIYRTNNEYIIGKAGTIRYKIKWEPNEKLKQLIRIQINPAFLEQYFKKKFSTVELETIFKHNKFIKFEKLESFPNIDTELNLDISLALNTDVNEENTKKTINQFTKNVYQTELKQIANTHATMADIINRNYAHHIGSHVSNRASFEKILDKLKIQLNDNINAEQIASIARMRKYFREV